MDSWGFDLTLEKGQVTKMTVVFSSVLCAQVSMSEISAFGSSWDSGGTDGFL